MTNTSTSRHMDNILAGGLTVGRFFMAGALAATLFIAGPAAAQKAAPDPDVKEFEKIAESLQKPQASAKEEDVLRMLELAAKTGRQYTASLIMRQYLKNATSPSGKLLVAAARNARNAADPNTALLRYKAYLANSQGGAEASAVAAEMYALLIETLGFEEDAYQFMARQGGKFREHVDARKFDQWFMQAARRKRDFGPYAERILKLLEEKLPPAAENAYFGQELADLMADLRLASSPTLAALPHLPGIIALVRNPERRACYGFYQANLQFAAAQSGRDAAFQEAEFKKVAAAAKAWFDLAPTPETLQDIFFVLSANNDRSTWDKLRPQKQEFCKYALGKLGESDLAAMRRWAYRDWLLGDKDWLDLAVAKPGFIKLCTDADLLPMLRHLSSRQQAATMAAALQGQASRFAVAVTSLAAGENLEGTVQFMINNHAAHLDLADPYKLLVNELWLVDAEISKSNGKGGDNDSLQKAVAALFVNYLAKGPAVVDTFGTTNGFLALWNLSKDKITTPAQAKALFSMLDWVPYDKSQLAAVYGPLQDEFKRWRPAAAKQGLTTPQLDEIAAELKRIATADRAFDPAKAPTPLAAKLGAAAFALRQKNTKGFSDAAGEILRLVNEAGAKGLAGGVGALKYAAANHKNIGDTLGLQLQILKSVLGRLDPENSASLAAAEAVYRAISDGRRGWPAESASGDKSDIRKLNETIESGLVALVDKGKFWPPLFGWMLETRGGARWRHREWNQQAMAKLIDTQMLLKHDHRPVDPRKSVTWNYMRLVWEEFPEMNKGGKYAVLGGFDGLFIEEARKTGFLDFSYWELGGDPKGQVAEYAAGLLVGGDSAKQARAFGTAQDQIRWLQRCALGGNQRAGLLAKLEEEFAAGRRFDAEAMGLAYFNGDLNVKAAPARKEFFDALERYLGRAAKSPLRLPAPNCAPLADIKDGASLSDRELDLLVAALGDSFVVNGRLRDSRNRFYYEPLVSLVYDGLLAKKRVAQMFDTLPRLWMLAADMNHPPVFRLFTKYGQDLLRAKNHELASILSIIGLESGRIRLPEDVRSALAGVRSKAASNIGGIIPVPENDQRYPIYASQAAFLVGNNESAWAFYSQRPQLLGTIFKEMAPEYTIWIIDRHTEGREFAVAEGLAQKMLQWVDTNPGSFDPETRARLLVSYAAISFTRNEYPRARAQLDAIVANKDFEGTRARSDAELKIAEIERLTRSFDKAFELLINMTQRGDRYLQMQGFYQLAMLKYDQEEYEEAAKFLERVFVLSPEHADGRILQGKVYLRRKKLIEATELDLGIATSQRILIPGTPFKVKLEDQNLSVVGKSTNVEIRVWTDSGDEEFFKLFPFGDSKTKFEGSLPTALALAKKGDNTIQVLGGDRINYDLSDSFKRANNITDSNPVSLSVVTDAEMQVSSGKILTKEEQEQLELERQIRAELVRRRQLNAGEEEAGGEALSAVRPQNQIKPGAPINVRIIDPDRGNTNSQDIAMIAVSASSGDRIADFPLQETGNHTGVFEAAVPTAPSPPSASATNSKEGSLPAFPIMKGENPPWIAAPDSERPKFYTVDLRDNVELKSMVLQTGVPGRAWKGFTLQTSLNGRTFANAGNWPEKVTPWNGTMELMLAKAPGGMKDNFEGVVDAATGGDRGFKASVWPDSTNIVFDRDLFGTAGLMKLENDSWVVGHLRAAFYQPERATRTFIIEPARTRGVEYRFTINREPSEDRATPLTIRRSLAAGVHLLDVVVYAPRNALPSFKIMCDTPEPPFMTQAPMEMFDPNKNPKIKEAVYQPPATIAQAKGEAGRFDITFPPKANARIVRLVIRDFEGDAPGLQKMLLTSAAGRQVLPVEENIAELSRNRQLEIVPGDKITLTYIDPSFVSPNREIHEAFLDATYHDAEVNACFINLVEERGQTISEYIPIHRFKVGDPVIAYINDPDGDTSAGQDTLPFSVRTTNTAAAIELKALETGNNTGIFIGRFFPVAGQPQRQSEIQVGPEDEVIIEYLDVENTEYGIPWKRASQVEQAVFKTPELRVFDIEEVSFEKNKVVRGTPPVSEKENVRRRVVNPPASRTAEVADDTSDRMLLVKRPMQANEERPAQGHMEVPVFMELTFPFIALSPVSEATVYLQTAAGRAAQAAEPADGQFDVGVPGTITVSIPPQNLPPFALPNGFRQALVDEYRFAGNPVRDGSFFFVVPLQLGEPGDEAAISDEEIGKDTGRDAPPPVPKLMIRGDDTVHIGFKYTDGEGREHWLQKSVQLSSGAAFAAMDRDFKEKISGIHVEDMLYYQVLDLSRDKTADRDKVTIQLKVTSGAAKTVELIETFAHTGIFTGFVKPVYATPERRAAAAQSGPGLATDELPVVYGDVIDAEYNLEKGAQPLKWQVTVHKGADGKVLAFTKQFKDPEIGVQTQFTIAESFFELAKLHRELGQDVVARREIAQGKKLLEEAIRDYPSTEFRAQADYLLANLSLEFANDAQNEQFKDKHYADALRQFSDIVATYPDSPYAPKAQFKKAMVFEKMGRQDMASEEYVKLSYRYPDNELVTETMARLGQYFWKTGNDLKKEADAIKDLVQQEIAQKKARDVMVTAAEVFGRLAARFPEHALAPKSTVLSGQAYMMANDLANAIRVFDKAIKNTQAEPELIAEAMYWSGDCLIKQQTNDSFVQAYRVLKRLTWDYPESKWAKFARGRLTEDALMKVEEQELKSGN